MGQGAPAPDQFGAGEGMAPAGFDVVADALADFLAARCARIGRDQTRGPHKSGPLPVLVAPAGRLLVQTARRVLEAAAGAKLGRRSWSRTPAGNDRGRGRRKGRKDLTGFGLGVSACAVLAGLGVFHPT